MSPPTAPLRPPPAPPPRHTGADTRALCGLPLLRLRFTLVATEPVAFSEPPGSTLCRVFGAGVARAAPDLFAPLIKSGAEAPYVLAPLATWSGVAPGEAFRFTLTLMGWAVAHVVSVIDAWRIVEEGGLGTGGARRGRCVLSRVEALSPDGTASLVLDRDAGTYAAPHPVSGSAFVPPVDGGSAHRVGVRFLSPTLLKEDGREAGTLTFGLLARRLAWRVRSLCVQHGEAAPDFRPLLASADAVRTEHADLHAVHARRHSARQSALRGAPALIPTGGFVGEATFAGPVGPFLPLFRLGTWLHVGKDTVRGGGRYALIA